MANTEIRVALSERELRLIAALRELPDSPLRELVHELFDSLVSYVREPRCPEMQADGVPCDRPDTDCEQCRHIRGMLENLRAGLVSPSRQ